MKYIYFSTNSQYNFLLRLYINFHNLNPCNFICLCINISTKVLYIPLFILLLDCLGNINGRRRSVRYSINGKTEDGVARESNTAHPRPPCMYTRNIERGREVRKRKSKD